MSFQQHSDAEERTKTVYLFGDQSVDVCVEFGKILSSLKGPTAATFIANSLKDLSKAVDSLPHAQSSRISRFSSYHDLIREKENGALHPALDQALACVYHLSVFITQVERHGIAYPTKDDAVLVGVCTGSIAAAAISACRSISELLPVAIHAVLVAFWTGVCAVTAGDSLYPVSTDGKPAHWSLLIPNMAFGEASTMLQDFAQLKNLPLPSTPWISATAERSVTISGPPDKLGALHRSETFVGRASRLLPIFAPYHAFFLFNQQSVDFVLDQAGTHKLPDRRSVIPVIAPYDQTSSWVDSLLSAMRVAVAGVLRNPIHWATMTEGVKGQIRASSTDRIRIVGIGTKLSQTLRTSLLNMEQVHHVEVEPNASLFEPSGGTSGPKQEKIAIIGMSGRFPEADDCEEFWEIISQGLDVHKPVPELHWSKEHVDPTGTKKNTSATPFGCWLKSPGMFDAKFFHMSPREAPQVDPVRRTFCSIIGPLANIGAVSSRNPAVTWLTKDVYSAQRLALLTAYEAMEDAGMVPESTQSTQRNRVGVFYGVTSNDWMETNSAQNIDTYFIPGGNRAFIPGRVNYHFKFSGPSYSVDTACSSSLASIHLACNALWRKEVDTAFAGGTNVLTNPDFTAGLDRGHFLSRTGNCKTFDDTADGYCRGEGAVTFILKRLEDAVADNDPVRGVILGAYTNHSAEADSITRPHVPAQKEIFTKILQDSGIHPVNVGYVEMHGTGTQAGDAGEMQSVLETFSPVESSRARSPRQPLYIGSAKSNIGHGEAASGASSLAKTLLMMKHNVIPPHCGIKTRLNRKFPQDMGARQTFIADKATTWTREAGEKRLAFVNNFSAAGGNSALLIEDAPAPPRAFADPRTVLPFCISAKTPTALEKALTAFDCHLTSQAIDSGHLADISYTTTARRVHYPHRALIAAADVASLRKGIQNAVQQKVGSTRVKAAPDVCFAFTGQGSQYSGMGKEFYATIRSFKQDLDHFDQISQSYGFPSFLSMIIEDGKCLTTHSPTKTQLALTCLEIALARLWMSWNIKPSMVVGHSLGEYAALCISGVLTVSDTIYLVGSRAQLLETRCTKNSHSMLAVKASVEQLEAITDEETVEVACTNGPTDTVLSGPHRQINSVESSLRSLGMKCTLLKVPFAFHSAQVEPILEDFHRLAQGVRFQEPTVTVLSPLKAKVEKQFDADYLRDHCRQTVNFAGVIQATPVLGSRVQVIEIGPQPVVSAMFKSNLGRETNTAHCLAQGQDPWKLTTMSLATMYQSGHNINWQEYNRDFQHRVVELPHYSWDLQHYWIDYVNDWSLRKGESLPTTLPESSQATPDENWEIGLELSTTIHKATSYATFKDTNQIVVESDICRPDLYDVVRGHEVDGFPLCTPSVYADIALSVAQFLARALGIQPGTRVTAISDMNITKALIAKQNGPQILRTTVIYDRETAVSGCKFESLADTGSVIGEHATCNISFKDESDMETDPTETIQKITSLRTGLLNDEAYQFNRSMIYKCIGALANFDPKYRGLLSVTMNSSSFEAYSVVEFGTISTTGTFHTHPAFLDALSQVGGFVMNCNDFADLSKEVFVNHGWGSFHMMEPISATETYKAHVKMRETPQKLWKGDIVVLKGERVVAKFCDIALQCVPRRLLKHVLASDGARPTVEQPASHSTPAAKQKFAVQKDSSVQSSTPPPRTDLLAKTMAIVAEESGLALGDLTDDLALLELGVDSLMSLLIVSRIQDELEVKLEQTTFAEMSTIQDIKSFIQRYAGDDIVNPGDELDPSRDIDSGSHSDVTQDTDPLVSSDPTTRTTPSPDPESCSTDESNENRFQRNALASSVVLQGFAKSAAKTIFLLPDGSGSAHSYIDIPNVGRNLAVIGLNCPFRVDALSMKHCSLESLIGAYVKEIRRRQPHGPYHLGGWSAGGILAYRATQMLIDQGEEVANLLLIDSPEPTGLDHLPQRFYDHCAATAVFGAKTPGSKRDDGAPDWLMAHFRATIDLLHDYQATPLPEGHAPKVDIIFAADCVFDGVEFALMPEAEAGNQDEGEAVKFLTEKRTEFSAGGWARLFPGGEVSVQAAAGAHHFSLLREKAHILAKFIDCAMGDCS